MLGWYRRLIEMRRALVIPRERTCRAEWRDGTLVMRAPASEPRVMVVARFPGGAEQEAGLGWRHVMNADEDDYRTEVYVRQG
jgi:hypothetical protein